jgi:hypothetical protein
MEEPCGYGGEWRRKKKAERKCDCQCEKQKQKRLRAITNLALVMSLMSRLSLDLVGLRGGAGSCGTT